MDSKPANDRISEHASTAVDAPADEVPIASSNVKTRGGERLTFSSEPVFLTLVNFFSLTGFTCTAKTFQKAWTGCCTHCQLLWTAYACCCSCLHKLYSLPALMDCLCMLLRHVTCLHKEFVHAHMLASATSIRYQAAAHQQSTCSPPSLHLWSIHL